MGLIKYPPPNNNTELSQNLSYVYNYTCQPICLLYTSCVNTICNIIYNMIYHRVHHKICCGRYKDILNGVKSLNQSYIYKMLKS